MSGTQILGGNSWKTRLACASIAALLVASCTSKPAEVSHETTPMAVVKPPVTDQELTDAQKNFVTTINKAVATSQPAVMQHRGDYVDEAYKDINFSTMTIDQAESTLNMMPIIVIAPKTSAAFRARLNEWADLPTADGARAAVMRVSLVPMTAKPEERTKLAVAAINHPGLESALAKDHCADIFALAADLPVETLFELRPRINKLGDSIRIDSSPRLFAGGSQFFTGIARKLKNEEIASFSPLRQKLSKVTTAKLKRDQDMLTKIDATLKSGFVQGKMVGEPAADVDFIWYNNPANPAEKITSLSQLKGKVVVLDFWATWCMPCQMSFPRMKVLSDYYKGYEVAFVGVTSPQGFVISNGKRVATGKDQDKEFKLVADFAIEKTMTWPIAESKQDVFNPDFGVYGIPDVVMIDTQGVVRFANMNPLEPESVSSDATLINSLLAEAKMPIPTAAVPPTPKVVFPGMRPPATQPIAATQPSATTQPSAKSPASPTIPPVVQAN